MTTPTPLTTAIGTLAYIYGFAPVVMEQLRVADLNNGYTLNAIKYSTQLATPTSGPFVTPNADTLYATAWLDLSISPLILSIPQNQNARYYSVQLLDAYTNTFKNVPQNPLYNRPAKYLLVGPSYQSGFFPIPDERNIIVAPTNNVYLVTRVEVKGDSDLANALAFEQSITLTSVNNVTLPAPPAPLPSDVLTGLDFFTTLANVMLANPPPTSDKSVVDQFGLIGFNYSSFNSASLAAGLANIIPSAQAIIATGYTPYLTSYNGWGDMSVVGTYADNYLARAYIALAGFAANVKPVEFYLRTTHASDGSVLVGTNNYVLTFAANQLPQVNAFWSINLYVGNSLVPNSAGIYALRSDANELVYNSDGSLDIYIQAAQASTNWLPAPASGSFNLTLRLYDATANQIVNPSNIPGITNLGPA